MSCCAVIDLFRSQHDRTLGRRADRSVHDARCLIRPLRQPFRLRHRQLLRRRLQTLSMSLIPPVDTFRQISVTFVADTKKNVGNISRHDMCEQPDRLVYRSSRSWSFRKRPLPSSLTVGAIRDDIRTFLFLLVLQIVNIF